MTARRRRKIFFNKNTSLLREQKRFFDFRAGKLEQCVINSNKTELCKHYSGGCVKKLKLFFSFVLGWLDDGLFPPSLFSFAAVKTNFSTIN